MFLRILKRDLKNKRGINFILFLFMLLATIFVASSVNNILVVMNATDYCMEKGKATDKFISTYEDAGEKTLDEWLDQSDLVSNYSKNEAVILSYSNIADFAGKNADDFICNGTMMLQSQWDDNMLIFDQNGEDPDLQAGQIGLGKTLMDDNGLNIGDTITLNINDTYFTFTIATVIMDPVFGSDLTGTCRMLISQEDFDKVKETGFTINYDYCIDATDIAALDKGINSEGFNVIVSIDREMLEYAYIMPMIMAGMLIVVGVCLIVIAFLILRFTISFTLAEDYKEIGIMKAIGLKNGMIKKIYLTKYMALVTVAAIIGCIVSIPISNAMIQSVSITMMMENASTNFMVNIVCSVLVAVIVLIMCYLCTNKLRKFSVIDAIRSGQSGEQFRKKSKLSLHKSKFVTTPVFLAVNDILSNIRRYIVLILTFTMGMLIIILPLNTLSTFSSTEMAKNFMLDTNADFYISTDSKKSGENDVATIMNREAFTKIVQDMQERLSEKGYEVTIESYAYYSLSYYADDRDSMVSEMTMVPLIETEDSSIEIYEGTAPVYDNEVALSEMAMKKIGVSVGDTVHVIINSEVRDFIVTGSYQNYMQMGNSAYMSYQVDVGNMRTSGMWMMQCKLTNMKFDETVFENLKANFSDTTFYNMQEAMATQLGSTGDQIQGIKALFVILICLINMMITILMNKIFLISEKGQIAMLRSMGYSVRTVRLIQAIRFGIIMLISAVLGAILSISCNYLVLRPIFGLMGATRIKIVPNPVEVYFLYPLLLLVIICIAAYLNSRSIKKLKLMDINNQE